MRRNSAATTIGALAVGTVVAFLAIPLIALFVRIPIEQLVGHIDDPALVNAAIVTIKTSLIAHVIILVVGTPASWAISRASFLGKGLVVSLVELPIVLPPAVAGIALLSAFGHTGLLSLGLPFTQAAVVLAICFVAGPLYVRQAISSFDAVDPRLYEVAATLGASRTRRFAVVGIPAASAGLQAASTLALARGIGEFGATIMFAGSFPKVTQTLPLAIYAEFDRDFGSAIAMGALLVGVSIVLLALAKVIGRSPWLR